MIKLDPVSKSEVARYMGIKGVPDENVSRIIDRYEKIVRERLRPNYVYRECDILFNEDAVHIAGIKMTGNDIRKHLQGCTKAIVFAVTVSDEADKIIRQAAVIDMAESLAADCLCSAAVEQVCEKAEQEIFSNINAPYRTWRFSPGYGDLPIDIQKDLLTLLNAQRRIGLTVTESCLLLPSKSVTAIIGISDTPVPERKRGCAVCPMRESCAFSKSRGCH